MSGARRALHGRASARGKSWRERRSRWHLALRATSRCPPGAVHGDVASRPPGGDAFSNGCEPRYLPAFRDPDGASLSICAASCRPVTTHAGAPMGARGAIGSGLT